MKIINPSHEILTPIDYCKQSVQLIEKCGRVCYKSEDKITPDSAENFCKARVHSTNPHLSVIEHFSVTVRFICDRGVSHELVRHRIASFSQESTRYCNYCDDKFGNELTFIKPFYLEEDTKSYNAWLMAMHGAEKAYFDLRKMGLRPQEARCVLPNSLKTEIVVTANLREWRTIFDLRCSSYAHPQMQQLMIPTLMSFHDIIPVIFDDLYEQHEGFFKEMMTSGEW